MIALTNRNKAAAALGAIMPDVGLEMWLVGSVSALNNHTTTNNKLLPQSPPVAHETANQIGKIGRHEK